MPIASLHASVGFPDSTLIEYMLPQGFACSVHPDLEILGKVHLEPNSHQPALLASCK